MRSIEEIQRELKLALKRNHFATAIALCREGARLCATVGAPEWYGFRFNLAIALVERRDPPTGRDLEEAIPLFSELASHPPSSDTERHRSNALMALGRSLQKCTRGDRHANVQRAISAFTECLRYYTKAFDADTWALVKTHLGYLYSELGATTGDSAYVKAIRCFSESLQVFSKAEFPEEWEEVQQALSEVEKRRKRYATHRGGPGADLDEFPASRN
jgi:tetratricopeptide (TPR) repeat protein